MSTQDRQRLGLDAAVAEYDRERGRQRLSEASDQREQFIARFPPTIWPDLPLERYALGLPDSAENFSRWLEFETQSAGSIKGGSAAKHLVYKRQSKPGWYYQASKYSSEQEAWDAIRHGFAELVQLGSEGRWSQIDEIDGLNGGAAIRTKTAWMYYPDQLLPIYSERHLDFFAQIFALQTTATGTAGKNRQLYEALTAHDLFAGWSPIEIMHFLYGWADPSPSHEILKIAPGDQATLWPDCLENGHIRVGWDETGDLTLLADVEEIKELLAERHGLSKGALTKTARGLDRVRSLKDGDIIVANRGTGTVVGIGRVEGGYEFRDDLPELKHTVLVDWFDTAEKQVDFGAAWRSTIVKVKPEQYHQIIQAADNDDLVGSIPLPAVPDLHVQTEKLLARTGQIILYGPPGTGKTFSARRHATWLLAGGSTNESAANAFGTNQQLVELEARFTTTAATADHHRPAWLLVASPQQWSWSHLTGGAVVDFTHGEIQANFEEVQPGDVVYGYDAVPTKAIVARASVLHGLHRSADGNRRILVGTGRLLRNGPTWTQLQSDPVLSASEPVRHGLQGTLFKLTPPEAAHLDKLSGVESGPSHTARAAGPGATGPADSVPQLTRVTFHPTYSYEDFIEGYKPTGSGRGGLELRLCDGLFKRVCVAAAADPNRPYVLLIDEINRGNVPKIFGELITLIEADKRDVTVTLPQSGDPFSVPRNVYLIATMNTADRSIHVLDTALRRRFAFVELLPDPAVLEGSAVGALPLDELLRELNTLIRESIGREKQLGHAVLMNGDQPIATESELASAFRHEILPHLQELTYGDYTDLSILLGTEIIDVDNQSPRVDVLNDPAALIAALAAHLEITSA